MPSPVARRTKHAMPTAFYIYLPRSGRRLRLVGRISADPRRAIANMNFQLIEAWRRFRAGSGIECRLTVSVAPQHDFEVRRCRLTNPAIAHDGSNLRATWNGCCARRRPMQIIRRFPSCLLKRSSCQTAARSWPDVGPAIATNRILGVSHDRVRTARSSCQHGSIRNESLAFIGRGRTLVSPLALEPAPGVERRLRSGARSDRKLAYGSSIGTGRNSRNRIFCWRFPTVASDVDIALARIESSLHIAGDTCAGC